ncbi:hypothetical protein KOR34_15720 [Posidoniimonas corsicana]|uniref:Uncharacterized protein n=1 Tax=Posidoniimonas corsicana TaxID=1938618 RepID=A0A5C5VF20_9BACT|nr:hypothetical protein [Posidoniimonas corsicana]TWT36633.1 hypothetical protein KOR34_15720 [Posidoniimonas corsicana]
MSTTKHRAASRSYSEQLQELADRYFAEAGQETATAKEIAAWALSHGHWEPPADLVLRKCREDFADAMREQYIKDDDGKPVRAKHVARYTRGDVQQHLWADIQTAPRSFMERAFNQRREQIVGDCRQLDRDVEYYNCKHADELPIQMVFDFTDDVEEGKFSGDYRPPQPR